MKNITKNALKIMLLVALFAPAAFADGDMGGGGFADNGNITKSGKVVITQVNEEDSRTSEPGYVDSFMSVIYDLLDSMI
jgi:hypothetical protein